MQKLNEISLAHYLPSRCVILKKKNEMNMAPFATQKILKFSNRVRLFGNGNSMSIHASENA